MNLRTRIVLAVTAVFGIVSLLAAWLMLGNAEKSLQTAFDRATQMRASWLLSLISVDPVVLPLPTENEQMRVVYETYGQSRELFHSPAPRFRKSSRNTHPRWQSYRAVTVQTTSDQTPDGRISLMLAVPDAPLQQDIARLRWVFGVGWLVSLLLAFGAGYGVASWLLRPIQAIINQASRINNTATITPIPLPDTRDELYQLTDTLNQMLARIRESAEMQRNFFGAAAHELRTPLAIMKTGLEVTLDSGRVGVDTVPFLTGQLDEVSRLTRLLDEFLTLSRPDNAAQPLQRAPVNMSALVSRCLTQLATVAIDYDVTFQVNESEGMEASLITDSTKLEHILLNLIENAIKYAVSGSVVAIAIAQPANLVISIRNRTVGESGPTLDLVQPYFQADPLKEGHGLGLWISHRLTTLLGGTLHLQWQDFTFTSQLIMPLTTPI